MTVGELRQTMSVREFLDWQQYFIWEHEVIEGAHRQTGAQSIASAMSRRQKP
jgi:hypothetical protein